MRYKALPPSVRRSSSPTPESPLAQPPSSPRRLRDWIALGVMVALLPALILPALVTNANGPSIWAEPPQALVGTSTTVHGTGFTPRARGYLALDGATAGPKVRVARDGTFAVRLDVPADMAEGPHEVRAMMQLTGRGKAATAFAVAATLTLVIIATDSGLQSPAGSGVAQPTPTATVDPTAGPTAATASGSPSSVVSPSPSAGGATPTPVPTSQPTLGSDGQPSLPVRAAFYYPWFPEAWNQQGMNPFTRYQPSLGYYDGSSGTTIRAHVAAMQYARVQVGIASWWGQSTRTDSRLPALMDVGAATGFRWAVYQEGEGQADPSVSSIRSDLVYLRDRYGSDPGYFRINGRFVVFVYADGADGCGMVDRWTAANADVGAYLVLKVFSGYRNCAHQPDGWHQYSPAVAEDSQAGHSYAISPGFWKANESSARLGRDLTRWARSVRNMVASGAPFQLITTFNEWGEGTSVESATGWASASGYGSYLDVLRANGQAPGASPQPTPAPTPGPTSAPTPMPTSTPGGSTTAVLLAAGDIAACGSTGDDTTAAIIKSMSGTVITLGDNAYEEGTLAQYNECYDPSWGQFKSRTRPVPGNHEYIASSSAQGYRSYFGWGSAPTYYAYNAGEWRVYALDSNCSKVGGCGPGSPQYAWLEADLTANPRTCALAYWHHPKFTIGPHANDEGGSGVLWDLLYAHGAEVVLNGHDHNYQRWTPMRPDGTPDASGIREIVNGAGGKNHTTPSRSSSKVEAANHDSYGVLKLTLLPGSYSWKFFTSPETYIDSGTTICH